MVLVWALSLIATPVVPSAEAAEELKDQKDPCAEYDFNEGAPSDEVAATVAKRCDRDVPVAEGRTEFSDAVVRPDGTGEFTAYAEPVRARDDKDDWAPIDTALRVRADGSIEPGNTVLPVTISGGGNGDFARIEQDGKAFGLSWPGKLPKPSVEGDTATYADVLPGVDLTVTAHAMGFSHNLVVKTRKAARSRMLERVRFGVSTGDAAVRKTRGGGLEVAGGDEPWLVAPAPMMWDSPAVKERTQSDRGGVAPGKARRAKKAVMDVEVRGQDLTLVTDTDVLRGEDTQYPVIIDPYWTGKKRNGEWATVSEKYPNTAYWKTSHLYNKADFGGAGVGRVCDESSNFTCYTPSYRMRSLFRMDTAYVTRSDARVLKAAKFKILQKHAWVCHDSSPLSKAKLRRISRIKSHHTWNDQPSWYAKSAKSTEYANHGAACAGGPADAIFRVKHIVDIAEANSHHAVNLGMIAVDESTVAHWKRFDAGKARITLKYNTKPDTPKYLFNDGKKCASTSDQPWVTTRRPQVSGRVYDADGSVKGHFRLSQWDESQNAYVRIDTHTSGFKSSGKRVFWKTGLTLSDGKYIWRMRSDDGDLTSDFTKFCHYRVDATPPKNVEISPNSDDPLAVGDSATFTLSATDKNGITKFGYGLDTESVDNTVSASGGSASVTLSDLSKGRHVLYVWAYDKAGNKSARAQHSIFVGTVDEAVAMGAWRLDGDPYDDSGEGNTLTLSSEAAWAADRNGVADSALEFTGTAGQCVTTSDSVIRTDTSYSVTAWVRLEERDRWQTFVSQAGENRPAFFFRYHANADEWNLALPTDDAETTNWQGLGSDVTPVLGEWTHLAATMDTAAKVVRFYVNGELTAERSITYTPWNATGSLLVGCAGDKTGDTWSELNGAIDQASAWQGLLTAEEIKRSMTELPARSVGDWRMQGSGEDSSEFARGLSDAAVGDWVHDEYARERRAAWLDGQAGSCMDSQAPILREQESFSVSAWVKLDADASGNATVISQSGTEWTGFDLGYDATADRWLLSVLTQGGTDPAWASVTSASVPVKDQWTHLTGVVDVTANVLRIYIDGQLDGENTLSSPVEYGAGSLLVGCQASASDGSQSHNLKGAVSNVAAYRGALTATDVDHLVSNPGVKPLAFWPLQGPDWWSDRTEDESHMFDDTSGNGNHLSEPASYSWVSNAANEPADALHLPVETDACSQTSSETVRTDESFTVAAWVKLDDVTADRAVMSKDGGTMHAHSMRLYHDATDGWTFELVTPSGDSVSVDSVSGGLGTADVWTHVAAVYDLEHGNMRLYVDGNEVARVEGPATPHNVAGPVRVGCVANSDGTTGTYLGGTVDMGRVWKSTVHEDRIFDLGQDESA